MNTSLQEKGDILTLWCRRFLQCRIIEGAWKTPYLFLFTGPRREVELNETGAGRQGFLFSLLFLFYSESSLSFSLSLCLYIFVSTKPNHRFIPKNHHTPFSTTVTSIENVWFETFNRHLIHSNIPRIFVQIWDIFVQFFRQWCDFVQIWGAFVQMWVANSNIGLLPWRPRYFVAWFFSS